MAIDQEIITRIFPIQGFELSPRTPDGKVVLGEDVDLTLAWMIGRAPNGAALLSLADDGSLRVSVQGAARTWYSYGEGKTSDDWDPGNTFLFNTPFSHFTISVSDADGRFQIRDAAGQWGQAVKALSGDTWDYDFSGTGLRFSSDSASSPAAYTYMVMG